MKNYRPPLTPEVVFTKGPPVNKEPPMTSPTARSLEKLRDEGWTARVVQMWISYRDAKLDAKLWKLVDAFLDHAELLAAISGDDAAEFDEKWQRWLDTITPIKELRTLYKPPVRPGIRKDLFGFGDILAFRRVQIFPCEWRDDIMIVQATSFANLNARIAKATVIPEFQGWIATGGLVEFHGWRVRKLKRGDGSMCKVVRFPESGREDGAG